MSVNVIFQTKNIDQHCSASRFVCDWFPTLSQFAALEVIKNAAFTDELISGGEGKGEFSGECSKSKSYHTTVVVAFLLVR